MLFEVQFQGIAMQAVAITVLVMVAMLALFALGVFRASEGFVAGVLACMFAVAAIYLLDIVLQSFFGSKVDIIHSNSLFGIGFSIFVCALAAFNFVIPLLHRPDLPLFGQEHLSHLLKGKGS